MAQTQTVMTTILDDRPSIQNILERKYESGFKLGQVFD